MFDKTHGLRFLQVSHLFFLICAQKNQTHCTYMWRHEDNLRTALRLATAIKISLTRAKHLKKTTQMVATTRFTIRVFVTFSDY